MGHQLKIWATILPIFDMTLYSEAHMINCIVFFLESVEHFRHTLLQVLSSEVCQKVPSGPTLNPKLFIWEGQLSIHTRNCEKDIFSTTDEFVGTS